MGPKGAGKDEERKKIQDAKAGVVRGLFAAGRTEAPQWALSRALPEFHREGDLARLGFNIEITPAPPTGIVPADKAPLESDVFQARLVLTADLGRGDPSKDEWRVESLDLLSARARPAPCPACLGGPRRSNRDGASGAASARRFGVCTSVPGGDPFLSFLSSLSFPSSAWERTSAKLRFASLRGTGREAELRGRRSQAELGNEGRGEPYHVVSGPSSRWPSFSFLVRR